MRQKSFFFHYNKPQSVQSKKVQITVHYEGKCHIVDNIICNVSTLGHIRKTQPHFVVKGKTKDFIIKNGVAIIN